MLSRLYKKELVFGTIVILIGAIVIPSISGNNITEPKNIIRSQLTRDVIFSDDFNDNSKDYTNWSERDTDGLWMEQNQRTEFYLNSNSGQPLAEAIKSKTIKHIKITEDESVIITCDMISNIAGNTMYGQFRIYVTDGVNFIKLYYWRMDNLLLYWDSNDADLITLGYREDGNWSNEIEIYSNRYRIQMDIYDSGWVYDSLFSDTDEIQVVLYSKLDLPYSGAEMTVGFDNVVVEGVLKEPKKTFIFGRLENLDTGDEFITFDAVKLRLISFFPFNFINYDSGEEIEITSDYLGIITAKLIIALCNRYI